MSETAGYTLHANGPHAGTALQKALNRRGILSFDRSAWMNAAERVRALENRLAAYQGVSSLSATGHSPAMQQIDEVDAMLQAFTGIEAFRVAAEDLQKGGLEELRCALSEAKQVAVSGADDRAILAKAGESRSKIEQLASQVHETLCRVEHEAVLSTIAESLEGLGYRVEQQEEQLRALQGPTCIWVQGDTLGGVQVDLSGFSGIACMHEMQRLETELGKRGLAVERTSSQYHGRPEGGAVAQKLQNRFSPFRSFAENNGKGCFYKTRIKQEGR